MMHLILVIAVVFVFAASCLMTFALCRAATRRDWREESAGSVSEESHESA
jgi:multisubunit Na+/H+ antiporter MnhG subunit